MKENNKRNEFGRGARIAKIVRTKLEEEEEKREKQGKKPFTPDQKRRYIKWETKKELRKSNMRAMIVALVGTGALTGIGTTALLNEKNPEIKNTKSEITIDAEKADKDIQINNLPDDRNVFIDGIKVDVENLDQDIKLNDMIKKEVETLETQEELLNYIKDIYVEEYNKQNKYNITREELQLVKKRVDEYIYRDKANNGDTIFRKESTRNETRNYLDTTKGVITARVDKGEAILQEKIINYNNEFKKVETFSANVEKYEDNALVKVGDIIDKGIDWYAARDEEETSWMMKEEYKNRFINALVNYKKQQIEEIRQKPINKEEDEPTID